LRTFEITALSLSAAVMAARLTEWPPKGAIKAEVTKKLDALRTAYGQALIPGHHLEALGLQIEAQRAAYESYDETIDVAVALVRAAGFDRHEGPDGPVYTARISFAKDREPLFVTPEQTPDPAAARA